MSHLRFYNYPGVGEQNKETYGYSQAVRIGDRIEISGQGGWKSEGPVTDIPTDLDEEVDQAFANVDLCLRHAGGKGWSQVFRINSYHVPLGDEAFGAMVRNFKKWMPDHQPLWTTVGVPKLGLDNMHVEIEVVAHDPEGASKASEEGASKKA